MRGNYRPHRRTKASSLLRSRWRTVFFICEVWTQISQADWTLTSHGRTAGPWILFRVLYSVSVHSEWVYIKDRMYGSGKSWYREITSNIITVPSGYDFMRWGRDGELHVTVTYNNNMRSSVPPPVSSWIVHRGVKGLSYHVLCDKKRLGCMFYF